MPLPAHLDYLFIADFKDGTRIYQDKRDCSRIEPLTRSAFWDVQQRIAEVIRFTLGSVDGQRLHFVDLRDGHFETDGEIILNPYGALTDYRLVYFRRVEEVFEAGARSYPRIVGYFFGWQANDEHGKNFQMMLEIPPLGLGGARITKK